MEGEIRPLPRFEYFSARSVKEVVSLAEQYRKEARLLAGGTDLLVWMKKRVVCPRVIIDISAVPELAFIEKRGEDLHIGAGTTLNAIRKSELVNTEIPLLAEAIGYMACQQIRNKGTIGGNICSASPAADTAPPLLVLGASISLASAKGERVVPLSEFFLGPGKTLKEPDEILREIIIPIRQGRGAFLKLGRRKSFTLSIVSVAAFGTIENGRFEDLKVAAGAVAPKPLLSNKVQEDLKGISVSEETIDHAAELIKKEVDPITDIRASASYRREMSGVLTKRALRKISGMEV